MHPGNHRRGIIFAAPTHQIMRITFILWGLVAASVGGAATVTEDFSADPLQNGWQIFGDTNLFQWDSTNQNLAVTWDSSQTNSYFYKPLGTILAKSDDFSLSFDLQLNDIAWSGSPELSVGLFHFSDAINPVFSRPAANTPNLFEFDYFPDNGVGQPTIAATLTDTNVNSTHKKDFYFVYDNQPLDNGVVYHVVLTHAAGQSAISGEVFANGELYSSLPRVFAGPITNFLIDTISISSYQNSGNSLLAHGTVDNIVVMLPPPPIQKFSGIFSSDVWQAQFISQSNWLYTLQRSADLQSWNDISAAISIAGNGTNLFLTDNNPAPDKSFYRVRADRP
jgi:hypothetical protein